MQLEKIRPFFKFLSCVVKISHSLIMDCFSFETINLYHPLAVLGAFCVR